MSKPRSGGAPEHTPVAPQLPPASVDFNALHDACMAGASVDDALAGALLVQARDVAPDEMPDDASDADGVVEPVDPPAGVDAD